jgi:hypothetical protein
MVLKHKRRLFNQGSTDEIRTAAGGAALKLEKRFFL